MKRPETDVQVCVGPNRNLTLGVSSMAGGQNYPDSSEKSNWQSIGELAKRLAEKRGAE